MTDPNKFWEEQKVKLAVKAERKQIIEAIKKAKPLKLVDCDSNNELDFINRTDIIKFIEK